MEIIMELNHREEIMWKQRFRVLWIASADKNTRFFHLRASQCRRKNHISKLCKPDGIFTENVVEMGAMVTDFYKTLYGTEGTTSMHLVLDIVPAKITPVMNEDLLAPFENDEIVVWTSLGPLPQWVPGPTTRWAPRTTRLGSHGT
jgi:hypothetical protein